MYLPYRAGKLYLTWLSCTYNPIVSYAYVSCTVWVRVYIIYACTYLTFCTYTLSPVLVSSTYILYPVPIPCLQYLYLVSSTYTLPTYSVFYLLSYS